MKADLRFEIECGKATCASAPGVFCRHFRGHLAGREQCLFFGRLYEDENGWIQRHPLCLVMAEPIHEDGSRAEPIHEGGAR